MIHDGALKKKTIYKYRAYAIEQREYDDSWVFMHYCPNGLQKRIWENNAIPLKNCDVCEETIPEEIILLWGLIDKETPEPVRGRIRNFNPTFLDYPR